MKTYPLRCASLLLGTMTLLASPVHAITVHNNGGPQENGNSAEITSAVAANDFALSDETTLTAFTFWASVDGQAPSFASQFSSTIGWAIFSDNGDIPGTLLHSGSDSAPTITPTGLLNLDSGEIVQVDATFTASLTLDPGNYWLALHEGEWASASDGTEIFWQSSVDTFGDGQPFDFNLANPTQWLLSFAFDGAFALQGEVNDGDPGNPGGGTPGTGRAIPEPATATLGMLGMLGLIRRRRTE